MPRPADRAIARPISSALANRFSHYELEANAEDWNNWAIAHNINPIVTGFINYRPNLLFKMEGQDLQQGWPSPRSWERASQILKAGEEHGWNSDLLLKKVAGCVGKEAGMKYSHYYEHYQLLLPLVNKVFDGKDIQKEYEKLEPTKQNHLVWKEGQYDRAMEKGI